MVDLFGEVTGGEGKSYHYVFFSSQGGKSLGRYASCNVGLHVGDDPSTVLCNRERLKQQLAGSSLLSALQVHGTKVHIQDMPLAGDQEIDGYDALITDQPGVALMVQHADCQPVLFYDSVAGVIAAVHNGWRGSVQNILAKVVHTLVEECGADLLNINAIIGPSLGPCCAEFVNYPRELPQEFHQFKGRDNYFDFWQISRFQLMNAGILKQNIGVTGSCTRCSSDYFSYRRAVQEGNGVTGRNGAIIVLHKETVQG